METLVAVKTWGWTIWDLSDPAVPAPSHDKVLNQSAKSYRDSSSPYRSREKRGVTPGLLANPVPHSGSFRPLGGAVPGGDVHFVGRRRDGRRNIVSGLDWIWERGMGEERLKKLRSADTVKRS